jgi:hypothetical protein
MSHEKSEVVVSAKVPRSVAEQLKRQAAEGGRTASAQVAELIRQADAVEPEGPALARSMPMSRAKAADRARFLVEQLSALVTEVERTDPSGARLLVSGVSSACWDWQTARLSRTDLLHESLERLAFVVDGERDSKERMDLWKTAMKYVVERTKANFEKSTGKRVEDA